MTQSSYNPDVLSCLANLSNDEVFTPPAVVNRMLDLLPEELWSNPDATFLDPVSKTGVFLREIAKRLIVGLADKIPDQQERIDHIFSRQLFGLAITELTALVSRRSVYCTKTANSRYCVCSRFHDEQGNIRYRRTEHTFRNGKCQYCGASEAVFGGRDDLETHAYQFIHTDNPQEIFNMKFDVIIGNPPYQLEDGGGGAGKSAAPIYQRFVETAKRLNPRYITMIIPSRWFAGGKGLDEFRQKMLDDNHIRKIVDYADSKSCFPNGVDIPGGICYFLWEREYQGCCTVINVSKGGETRVCERPLNEFPILIRYNDAISIIRKVQQHKEATLNSIVSNRKPFGLDSNTKYDDKGDILLRSSSGLGKILRGRVTNGFELINKWKVIVSKVSFEHGGIPDKDGMMRVLSVIQKLEPNSVCTESYLVASTFNEEKLCDNFISFLKTRFVRFLIMQSLASMNMTKATYQFVPIVDFSEPWTDEKLYAKYNLSTEEIAFIESMIRPME